MEILQPLVSMLRHLELEFDKPENQKFISTEVRKNKWIDEAAIKDTPLGELVQVASSTANSVLIAGKQTDERLAWLRQQGFKIYAGEKDSIGWLWALIEGKNYALAYG